MAEYTVLHSCGHEVKHRYDGPDAERKQRQDWLRGKPCQKCAQADQVSAAVTQRENLGLPVLDGSEADVRWAEVIRAKAVAHNQAFYTRVTRSPENSDEDELHQAIVSAADCAMRELESQVQASWWIENRFEVIDHLRRATIAAVNPLMDDAEDS